MVRYIIILICLISAEFLNAQPYGYSIENNQRRTVIPFTQVNNLIIVQVQIDSAVPRNFILDSGSSYNLLTKPNYLDSLGLVSDRKIPIYGSDRSQVLMADVVRNVTFRIGNVIGEFQSVLVLEEDILRFEDYMGIEISGILGIDFFRRFVVRIDYDQNQLTVHDMPPKRYPRRFEAIPITMEQDRIFIDCLIQQSDGGLIAKSLMLDTGASLALMFNTDDENVVIPENYIFGDLGRGLGGNIQGFVGRVDYMFLGSNRLNDILSSYHIPQESEIDVKFIRRTGIIGSEVLSRFEVIIDLINNKLLLSPTQRINDRFEYDMSGMVLEPIADENFDFVFNVDYVMENSPAHEAGIRNGDILLNISGIPGKITPVKVFNLLRSRPGRQIKATLLRDDMEILVSFRLKRMI